MGGRIGGTRENPAPRPEKKPETSWFDKNDGFIVDSPNKMGIKRLLETVNEILPDVVLDSAAQDEWAAIRDESIAVLTEKDINIKNAERKLRDFIERITASGPKDKTN